MQELPFLRSARRLMLIDICMKFCEDSLRGFQVTERTRFVTDRQTDGQTDRRTPGEKQYVSKPFGGRHNEKDPIKNNREKEATPFFKLKHYLLPWKPVVASGRISNSSKLLCISSLPASMKRIR